MLGASAFRMMTSSPASILRGEQILALAGIHSCSLAMMLGVFGMHTGHQIPPFLCSCIGTFAQCKCQVAQAGTCHMHVLGFLTR